MYQPSVSCAGAVDWARCCGVAQQVTVPITQRRCPAHLQMPRACIVGALGRPKGWYSWMAKCCCGSAPISSTQHARNTIKPALLVCHLLSHPHPVCSEEYACLCVPLERHTLCPSSHRIPHSLHIQHHYPATSNPASPYSRYQTTEQVSRRQGVPS